MKSAEHVGLKALLPAFETGDEDIDEVGDDDETECATYFRLLTTVGVVLGLPAVWPMGSFKVRPLTSTLLNGSGMDLNRFSVQDHGGK